MPSITVRHKGDFKKTKHFFDRVKDWRFMKSLEPYAQRGVDALEAATPKRTGTTARSWSYEIEHTDDLYTIRWNNSNVERGINIALLIQLGHGTGTGGYVEGIDYINPAMKPIFDEIAKDVWEEVTSL